MELTMWYSPVCTKNDLLQRPHASSHQCSPISRVPSLQQARDTEDFTHVHLLCDNPPITASPKLHGTDTPSILHMLQIQLLILLTLRMEINSTDTPINLIKTNVIEALEAGACDCLDAVVWHEEIFFPAHEDVLALLVVFQCEGWRFGGFCQRAPGREARPVLQVDFFRGAPGGVSGFEEVFGADYFAFEECGQGWMVVCEAWEVCVLVVDQAIRLVGLRSHVD